MAVAGVMMPRHIIVAGMKNRQQRSIPAKKRFL